MKVNGKHRILGTRHHDPHCNRHEICPGWLRRHTTYQKFWKSVQQGRPSSGAKYYVQTFFFNSWVSDFSLSFEEHILGVSSFFVNKLFSDFLLSCGEHILDLSPSFFTSNGDWFPSRFASRKFNTFPHKCPKTIFCLTHLLAQHMR